jgi:superkiller protein 3
LAALASYELMLTVRPGRRGALIARQCARRAWLFPEALVSYERVLAKISRHLAALDNRGNALALLGRSTEVLASYECLLAIEPGYAAPGTNRGMR